MNQREADKTNRLANSFNEGVNSFREGAIAMNARPRNITTFEESVLRAVHHEFAGLSQEAAAERLDVSPATISRALADMEERAKTCKAIGIMFPILTVQQHEIFKCLMDRGLSALETAIEIGVTEAAVNKAITMMRSKGMHIPKLNNRPKTVTYFGSMDTSVTEKF
jgi:predicted transcriptional regulator